MIEPIKWTLNLTILKSIGPVIIFFKKYIFSHWENANQNYTDDPISPLPERQLSKIDTTINKKVTGAGEEAKMTPIHCCGTVASSATMEISVLISQNQNITKNSCKEWHLFSLVALTLNPVTKRAEAWDLSSKPAWSQKKQTARYVCILCNPRLGILNFEDSLG